MRTPSNLPPGCTDREIEEAFGVPEGYEAFAEEFAGGDHDAAERVAQEVVSGERSSSSKLTDLNTIWVVAWMLEQAENLERVCGAMCIGHIYDAALEAAWRDHQEAGADLGACVTGEECADRRATADARRNQEAR